MRKFLALLRQGSPSLLTALERLVGEILKESQRRVS